MRHESERDEGFARIDLWLWLTWSLLFQGDTMVAFNMVLRRCRNSFLDKNNNNGEKPASFAKTLTQSDANNGGGFSVPRYCAVTIFPRLDYSTEPPIQTIIAKDVYGQCWKFRHIYKGTPRRYLLTTGWSNFVNHKKLIAGDSIVFL
ncbi:hypothetical protein AHAS_Ahas15G0160500 [Arachis hypogaea]